MQIRDQSTAVLSSLNCLLISVAATRDTATQEVFRNNSHIPWQIDQCSSSQEAEGSTRRCWCSQELHNCHPVHSRRPERLGSWRLSLVLRAHAILLPFLCTSYGPVRRRWRLQCLLPGPECQCCSCRTMMFTGMKVRVSLLIREVISLQYTPQPSGGGEVEDECFTSDSAYMQQSQLACEPNLQVLVHSSWSLLLYSAGYALLH